LKRLQAIEEFTELGSGFLIAMRDLEIRGAGNLLGAEQSGFINAIGFDLYCQILEQAVQDIRRELNVDKPPAVEPEKILDTQIRVVEDTYLPESYINVGTERIRIYQELSGMRSIEAVDGLRSEVIDRFGPLPVEAQNLFNMVTLKIMASFYGIAKFSVQPEKLVLGFDEALVTRRDLADVFQTKVGTIMNATKNVRLHQAKRELEVWVGYPGYDLQKQYWSGKEPDDRLQWSIEFMKALQSSELLQLA
jgi:transcription-repair coupling factor (superfamily II helicase)